MATLIDVNSHAQKFSSRILGLQNIVELEFTIGQLRNSDEAWKEWEKEPGIYCFVQKDQVQYVGRATPSVGLGSRVYNQINAFGNRKWDQVIQDDSTFCKVFVFKRDDWHWLASLELNLIEKLERPPFNKKTG
jgi:hypothetical protein